MQMQNKPKPKRKHRAAAPLAGLFVLLALVGVVTVVVQSIRLTTSFLDNDAEKQMFEDIIRPLVMFNPMPFEDASEIEMVSLLQYSMWAALTGDKRSSYQYEDFAELRVPASDLDVAAARLFGPEIQLVHQSFGSDTETRYYFEEAENVYNVPVTAVLSVYSPKVTDIQKDGDFYNLTVAYIPPASPLNIDFSAENAEPAPDKYMIYVMKRTGDHYQVAKVQDPPQDLENFGNLQNAG